MRHPLYMAALLFSAVLGCNANSPPITEDEVRDTIRAETFAVERASKFADHPSMVASANDKLTARILLAEVWMRAGSPVRMPEVRQRLKKLVGDAPQSWQAQVARLQILRTFDVHTETDAMIAAANEALANASFDLLNNPQDPLLKAYLETIDYGVQDHREVCLYTRGACFAMSLDLEKAREDYNALREGELKKQLGYQIRDLEALTPEQRAKLRQALIETVKQAADERDKASATKERPACRRCPESMNR